MMNNSTNKQSDNIVSQSTDVSTNGHSASTSQGDSGRTDSISRQVKGIARLIRYTPNPEETVAFAAKLCYSSLDAESLMEKTEARDNAKFVKALFDMGHLSPFEHASFTFSIEGVSRSLLAQLTRHRIASFSVRSQRYVSEDEFGFVMPPSIAALGEEAVAKYKSQMDTMMGWYKDWQTELGGKSESANEDARFVLPNACETKMIMTMNARELLHFFEVRGCERAQWEIREIAWQMMRQTLEVAPNIFAKSGPGCTFSHCTEGKFNCGKAKEIRQKRKDLTKEVFGDESAADDGVSSGVSASTGSSVSTGASVTASGDVDTNVTGASGRTNATSCCSGCGTSASSSSSASSAAEKVVESIRGTLSNK